MPSASAKAMADRSADKLRCTCGKWWALRNGATELVLQCKRCKRDIVITGVNLKVEYR